MDRPAATLTRPRTGAPVRVKPRATPRYTGPALVLTGGVIALYALFFLWPGVLGLLYSFTSYHGYGPLRFIGLENYTSLATDPTFYAALGRTFVYTLFSVPLGYVLSLTMAVALTNATAKGKSAARVIFFLPWLVSPIVTGVIWRWLFGENFGFVNFVIGELGGHPAPWATNANLSLLVVIFASAWAGAAFNMLLFISALRNVPVSLYEAAQLDGANAWQRFARITIPAIRPTSLLVILLLTMGQMKEFALIQALNNGGPGTQNQLIVQYIYTTGFAKSQVGYASAASMVLLVILMGIALVQIAISRRSES
ncbi:sugar ABC transporter permease [Cellulomonas sp. NTE-D12]|uniref:carbohydrate ABC transporter permease n=1 Tax=Cellulomonas sp. NTE-D12 TaxID=2962632 RepID=UPI003081A7DC|nr:sugar ABC transporter permease [Cellulomonas sp. NTE-D12]